MNSKIIIFIFSIILFFVQCKKNEDCTNIDEPVCGSDDYDYPNGCYARQMGVNYTQGYCTFKSKGIILNNQCGWVIQIDSLFYSPNSNSEIFYIPEIPMEIQEHGLRVEVVHTRFSDGIGTCFEFEDKNLTYGFTEAKLISITKI